jgi:hypothetical protein
LNDFENMPVANPDPDPYLGPKLKDKSHRDPKKKSMLSTTQL